MKTKKKFDAIVKILILSGITILVFSPVMLTVLTSIKPMHEIITAHPEILPQQPTLENYHDIFSHQEFLGYLLNSFLVAGLTAFLSTILASFAAYAMVWFQFPGKRVLSRTVFLTYMFPEIILVIPLFLMCNEMNLIDNRFSLVLVYLSFSLPFSIWLLKVFFESLTGNLIEAAMLDGCNDLQCLLKIILPLSRPVLITVFVLSFVMGWNEYLYANTLIISDSNRTIAVGLQTLIGYHQVNFGLLTAAGVIMMLPVLVLFLIVQKYIIHDLSLGQIK